MLEAYSKLKWDLPDIRLIVVGPGQPDRDSYRILGARSLRDVEFVGKVSYDDLARYYASADIFCSPATGSESFGIVLLEAMAAGKPVVASKIEGYDGIMTHNKEGLLFPPKDAEALSEALAQLIENPELARRLGASGRQTVDKYRWSVVAAQVVEYYENCLRSTDGIAGTRAA